MSPDVLSAVSDQERKRQEAIFELLSSERNYVDSLKLVMEVSRKKLQSGLCSHVCTPPHTHTHTHTHTRTQVFFDPLVESEVLSEEELSKVRVNWEEILQNNTELLK